MTSAIDRWLCRLRGGHDFVFRSQDGRQWLQCVTCWHATPGWDVQPSSALLRLLRFQARLREDRKRVQV